MKTFIYFTFCFFIGKNVKIANDMKKLKEKIGKETFEKYYNLKIAIQK